MRVPTRDHGRTGVTRFAHAAHPGDRPHAAMARASAPADAAPRLTRRALLLAAAGALGAAGCQASPPASRSVATLPIADAHSHYGFFSTAKIREGPALAERMRAAGVTLLAWAMPSDSRWVRPGARRLEQVAQPAPGELARYFDTSVARARGVARRAGLPFAATPDDVDAAARGEPHLVMAIEGADFLEGSVDGLARAHAAGVRHVQLVHYIRNPIGDFQTEAPVHGGLTAFGESVVRECNRLGMLVDLAHGTRELVDRALDVSSQAMIWSHSAITETDEHWSQPGGLARRLHISRARRIADRGGAIGLWALAASTGYRPSAYADSLLRAAELVGPSHVMIGTDTDGLGPGGRASVESPADLRTVVDALLARGTDEGTVRAICFGNYARCLRAAMAARTA